MLRKCVFIFLIFVTVSCSGAPVGRLSTTAPERFDLSESQSVEIGVLPTGKKIYLGGFSGLIYEGKDPVSGEDLFLTHTDRGPNFPVKSNERTPRVGFSLPRFQPEWVRLALDRKRGQLRIRDRVPLRGVQGKPLTGLPNGNHDETPIDARDGKILPFDPMGLDLESITKANDGTYWMGDEYAPSLCHFKADGTLIERLSPGDSLPATFSKRRMNRGFEGVSIANGKLYAFLQSPLQQGSKFTRVIRVLEWDLAAHRVSGEYLYELEDGFNDRKIGDVIALPGAFPKSSSKQEILVLEQTSKKGGDVDKKIFRVDLSLATNILSRKDNAKSPYESFDSINSLDALTQGIHVASKKLVVDLGKQGYDSVEKAEGIAMMDADTLAVISDNDFGLNGETTTQLWIFHLDATWRGE